MTIARHYFRLQRVSLIVWLSIIVLLAAVVAASTSAVTQGNVFQELIATLPLALQRLIGAGIPNPVDAYITVKLLFITPAMLGANAVMAASAALTRETDRGTADFLLSLPVRRERIVAERFIAVVLALLSLYVVMWLTIVVILEAAGLHGSYTRYALALLGAWAINAGQAGLALALSMRFSEYSRAVRYALGFLLATYGLEIALKSAGALPGLRYLLLFRFADPIDLVTSPGRIWLALLVGLSISALAVWWSQRSFTKRQLEA